MEGSENLSTLVGVTRRRRTKTRKYAKNHGGSQWGKEQRLLPFQFVQWDPVHRVHNELNVLLDEVCAAAARVGRTRGADGCASGGQGWVLLSLPLLRMPPLLPAQTAVLMLHPLLYQLRLRDTTIATAVPATLVKPERLDLAGKFAGAALLDLLLHST